ncbi:MAG: hypothetical protein SNG27_08810 [Rikenellaceae bacterium]
MKTKLFSFLSLLCVFCSCSKQTADLDGITTNTIKLSNNNIYITNDALSATINTGGDQWAFSYLEVDNNTYPLIYETEGSIELGLPEGYYVRTDVIDGFFDGKTPTITEIITDWITINRTLQTISISAKENKSGMKRIIKIGVQDAGYWEPITITQQ